MNSYDVICIGAGPTGLASAIEVRRAGMKPLVIDKGCLCNSLYHYPVNMVFFTTPELLEIGDVPLTCAGEKPTRQEALKYYLKVLQKKSDDPAIRREAALAYGRVGRIQHFLGRYAEADVAVMLLLLSRRGGEGQEQDEQR